MKDYDGWSDACQDAFDDFVDCVDDNDKKCTEVQNECVEEATKMLNECGDEL